MTETATKTRLWYPHYVRDFKAKTAHLSLSERGAYRALMDEYWERQGPIPSDDKVICRLIGCFPDEWAEVRDAVLAFFTEEGGKLQHKRIQEEIDKAVSNYEAKRERMAKAREAKAARNSLKDSAEDKAIDKADDKAIDSADDKAIDKLVNKPIKHTPSPAPSPSPVSNETQEPRGARKRASRLADDWRPPPEFINFAISEGLSENEAQRESEKFRDYWLSQAGAKGRKADWLATWRNWIRRSREFNKARCDAPGKMDSLRNAIDIAKEFDRRQRESVPRDSDEGERCAIGPD